MRTARRRAASPSSSWRRSQPTRSSSGPSSDWTKASSAGAVVVGDGKVQEPERAGDHRPHARVVLACEASHQGEELLEGSRAGKGAGPGVGDEAEAFERLEPVEAGEDALEELVVVADPVDAAAADVEHEHPGPSGTRMGCERKSS